MWTIRNFSIVQFPPNRSARLNERANTILPLSSFIPVSNSLSENMYNSVVLNIPRSVDRRARHFDGHTNSGYLRCNEKLSVRSCSVTWPLKRQWVRHWQCRQTANRHRYCQRQRRLPVSNAMVFSGKTMQVKTFLQWFRVRVTVGTRSGFVKIRDLLQLHLWQPGFSMKRWQLMEACLLYHIIDGYGPHTGMGWANLLVWQCGMYRRV